jgi:hypothetical protein
MAPEGRDTNKKSQQHYQGKLEGCFLFLRVPLGAGVMAQVVEHCLACSRPWVPSPAQQKKKKKIWSSKGAISN